LPEDPQNSISPNKPLTNAELPITGELTYFTLDTNKTDLLIQNGQSFTHISDVGSAKKAASAKIIKMPDNTLFYHKGKLANVADDVLFYFTADEVLVYNLKTATILKRLPVDSFYKGKQSIGAKRKGFVIDSNGDGLSDVITSNFDNLNLYVQTADGEFEHQKLELAPEGQITSSGVNFSEHQATSMDANNDGLLDLAFNIDNELMVFAQNKQQRFATTATTIALNAGILSMKQKRQIKGQGDIEFDDINNDGLQDYYTISLEMGVGAVMSLMSGSIDMDLQFYQMSKNHTFNTKLAYEDELEVQIDMDDNDGKADLLFRFSKDKNSNKLTVWLSRS
jgi:hypothetical protein